MKNALEIQQSCSLTTPLKIKGTFLPASQLQPTVEQLTEFETLLQDKLSEGARFLLKAPLVLDLSAVEHQQEISLRTLLDTCTRLGVSIAAVRATVESLQQQAQDLKVPCLSRLEKSASPPAQSTDALTKAEPVVYHGTVRCGQQLISEQGDLLVLGSVNPGAELLASGNIHVYGALRGKALAGIYGHEQARILTQWLDAELVAIDGHYKTSMNSEFLRSKKPACLRLEEQDLVCQFF